MAIRQQTNNVFSFNATCVQEEKLVNKPMHKNISSINDRRWPVERRQFSYTLHIPERRLGRERRGCGVKAHVIDFITANKSERVLAA
jgi:hypothetical protein